MSRSAILACALLAMVIARAQPISVPLSRTVEAPWAAGLHSRGSGVHTAVRPYFIGDLRAVPSADALQGKAALGVLDRWGKDAFDTAWSGMRCRGGPLLDATVGLDGGGPDPLTWRAGAGLWTELDIGRRWNLHLDAQGFAEDRPAFLDSLVSAQQYVPGEGYAFGNGTATAHYDGNAWVSFVPDDAITLTLGRGKNFFGEGHRSLFLSDNAASYPFLRINTRFWRVNYTNLFTVLDDIRGAEGLPADYQRKYASFHYLSWNALHWLNVAVFEGVVWQGVDERYPRGFDINYLNPVVFYRPVEYSQGSGDNSLLGFAINIKPGERSVLYTQLMLDEFLLDNVRAGNGWFGNKQAFQVGFVAYEAFAVKALTLRAEFNYVRPFMYTHSDTRQNYAHAGQALAHPYGSNFHEALVRAEWRRGRWTGLVHVSLATLGQDTGTFSWGNNIFRPESHRPSDDGREDFGFYLGDPVSAQLVHIELLGGWTIDPRTGMRVEAACVFRDRKPAVGPNEFTTWLRLGISTNLRQRYNDQEVRYRLP